MARGHDGSVGHGHAGIVVPTSMRTTAQAPRYSLRSDPCDHLPHHLQILRR